MKKFTCVEDIGDLHRAVAEALDTKRDRFRFTELGRNRTLLMLFFNSSLRTRLSTQKAAMNLGMNTIVLDVNQGAWKLETERGVIMDGDKCQADNVSDARYLDIQEPGNARYQWGTLQIFQQTCRSVTCTITSANISITPRISETSPETSTPCRSRCSSA